MTSPNTLNIWYVPDASFTRLRILFCRSYVGPEWEGHGTWWLRHSSKWNKARAVNYNKTACTICFTKCVQQCPLLALNVL